MHAYANSARILKIARPLSRYLGGSRRHSFLLGQADMGHMVGMGRMIEIAMMCMRAQLAVIKTNARMGSMAAE